MSHDVRPPHQDQGRDYNSDGSYIAYLNPSETDDDNNPIGSAIGPGISLQVKPGDQVNMEAYVQYEGDYSSGATVDGIAAAVAGAFGYTATTETQHILDMFEGVFGATTLIDNYSDDNPRIYLQYLLLDESFGLIDFGYKQVGEDGEDAGNGYERLSEALLVKAAGYLYIYVANESMNGVEAYFDDISVEHIESKVSQVADYYPFGMQISQTSTSITSPLANKYLYNGKELQSELGLDWYDYGFRMYDPALGRFPSLDPKADEFNWVSPYNYAENRPIDGIDLWGLQWESIHDWNQEITNQAHIDNLGDAYFEGMTYAQAWEVRAPAILERLEGQEFDCADLSIYALTEFAAYYKLPIHIEDYKAEGADPTFDNDSYGFQHPDKGWVSFKEGEWQRFAENVGAFYGASDLYYNNKIAEDISFDDVKAGDLIGIKYPSAFHSQTVHSVSRPSLWYDSYTTIQGSLHGGQGVPAFKKSYSFWYIQTVGDTKARRWNFNYFDKN